jgi:hypothetical protein
MIQLNDQERAALCRLAETEKRDLRAQAVLLIRNALEHRGLIANEHAATPNASVQEGVSYVVA